MQKSLQYPEPAYKIYRDGNTWCAVGADFVDLQSSPSGFGTNPTSALEDLLEQQNNI